MKKERIDKVLVDKKLVASRQKAQALIMAGQVLVDETPITKAGTPVCATATVRIKGNDNPFVSRGGLKLDGALKDLDIDMAGAVVLDIGASTGGFTDCCLQRGARHVFAVDVGTNQLDYRLRRDDRVTSMEQTNARQISPDMFHLRPDTAVLDVSFISITKVLHPTSMCLTDNGRILAMVKPQFEVGPENVGRGGVVRDDAIRHQAVRQVIDHAVSLNLTPRGQVDARLAGPRGNREIFVFLEKTPTS